MICLPVNRDFPPAGNFLYKVQNGNIVNERHLFSIQSVGNQPTGQRRDDIAKMKSSDIKDGYLHSFTNSIHYQSVLSEGKSLPGLSFNF